MKQKLYLLIAFFLCSVFALSQDITIQSDKPYIGERGIKMKVADLQVVTSVAPKTSLTNDANAVRPMKFHLNKHHGISSKPGDKDEIFLDDAQSENVSDATQSISDFALPGKSNTQDIWSNFLGSNFDEAHSWPPDPNGAVGPNQVILMVNAGIKVFDKLSVTDAPLVTPKGYSNKLAPSTLFIPLNKFFSPVLPSGSFASDPHLRYDRLSKRWFAVCIEVNATQANNYVLLAVSSGERVTDSSSFTYFRYPSALFAYSSKELRAPFLDYPTLGVDKNALMIGGIDFMYSGDSVYFVGYAVNKQRLLRGTLQITLIKLGIYNFVNGVQTGMGVPQGVQNDDPTVNRSFFIGNDFNNLNKLWLARLDYNATGTVTGLASFALPVAPYNGPRDISSPGGMEPIDPLDTRFLAAEIHKNKLTGASSLWTAHAVGLNQFGAYVSDSNFDRQARDASRWYEIGNIYTTPTISQLGNVYDQSQPSGRRATQYFNCSIAASGQGHAVLGGTTAAYNQYLNVYVAGRYSDDEKGTLNKPVKATKTKAMYAPYSRYYGYVGRWGDFSQTVVDPMDDQTIWTFQEYANVDDGFGVRVVQLKAPPPPQTLLPLGTFSNKEDTTVSLTGISLDHSGFFDPGTDAGGPGYNRLTVKSSGGVIVSNVKFVSPTQITFTLNTVKHAAGKYTLIITNPDGQLVTADYKINNKEASVVNTENLQINSMQAAKEAGNFINFSSLFPNPTTNNATIQVNATKNYEAKVIIVDMSGKLMYEKSVNFGKGNNEVLLSLSSFGKGTYFAGVYNSDNVLIAKHKIVKQ